MLIERATHTKNEILVRYGKRSNLPLDKFEFIFYCILCVMCNVPETNHLSQQRYVYAYMLFSDCTDRMYNSVA